MAVMLRSLACFLRQHIFVHLFAPGKHLCGARYFAAAQNNVCIASPRALEKRVVVSHLHHALAANTGIRRAVTAARLLTFTVARSCHFILHLQITSTHDVRLLQYWCAT